MFRRQIILASRSKARKKLLENVGLKVRVIPSGAKESQDLKYGPAALVKANAAKKALEVSRRLKSGIIIAADTLSIADNKVFGKPKDYSQAVKWLRKLSRKAHYVYTGLAVLKKVKGASKLILDYEKTRVWMRKMSADEIKKYLSSSGSIDKAGSFDIQGKGAFFIQRIDGCFYNVVGLPIAKLYAAFKKLNISIFILFFVSIIGLFGCATEYNIATKQEDIILYDTEKEVKIGRQA
jgi:septum formation protein